MNALAIQQMMVSGRMVVIPPGKYVMDQPIVLSKISGLTVVAYGVFLTASPTQVTGDKVGDTLRFEYCNDINFFGLQIDGNRAARGGFQGQSHSVHLLSSNDIVLRDFRLVGAVCDGIFVWGGFNPPTIDLACQRTVIETCRIYDPGRNGVSLVNSAWASVRGNYFEGPGGDPGNAVDIEANAGDPAGVNHHNLIVGNRAFNVKGGFYDRGVAGSHHNTINDNVIDNTTWDAISTAGTNTVIGDNNVSNCVRAGVSCLQPGTMVQSNNNAVIYQQ